jgi:hypothetical protein
MEPFEIDEFWEDLLAFIEDKTVIPVIGAELLRVNRATAPVALYRAVAARLLEKYRLDSATIPGGLREHHELNDAVCGLLASMPKLRVQNLYRPISDILHDLVSGQSGTLQPLQQLAAIRHFDLFATTTPDTLLVQALNATRFGGLQQTDEIEYAPKLPTDRRKDIPEVPSSRYSAVFYLFGKVDPLPFYAIHDEDMLEFSYTLQAGNGPERMFSRLRSRNLLLIGCTFSDWLTRFFLRLSSPERLFSDQRIKREFLVGEETNSNHDFTVFLQRFSQDSRSYPVDACAFVNELYQRWAERNPSLGGQESSLGPQSESAEQLPGGDIFLSYSSDDVGAAKQLFADLEQIGGDVAWFDKTELKPGDDWDERIKGAVQRCSLFLPLLSANTERRTEGYFRLEWNEAAERSRRIQGRKFIFPIVIDSDDAGAMGRYQLVPDQFRSFQYSHAPAGKMSKGLQDAIQEQLRSLRRPKKA